MAVGWALKAESCCWTFAALIVYVTQSGSEISFSVDANLAKICLPACTTSVKR